MDDEGGGNKEANEEEITNIYTEHVYYVSNSAPGEYEVHFSISMSLIWNDENNEEKKYIKDIHDDYVLSFRKKNAK